MHITKKIAQFIFKKLKLKNTITIDSFFGESIDQNCVYIANKLVDEFKVIFITNKSDTDMLKSSINVVPYGSFKHIYYLHTSKLLVNNSRYDDTLTKRSDQKCIQIWHGVPYKKLVFDQSKPAFADSRSKFDYLSSFLLDIEKWDILFAQNKYTADKFRSAFLFDDDIRIADYPSDKAIEVTRSEADINVIKDNMGINKYKKIILYTPTFREYNLDETGNYALTAILPKSFFEKHSEYCFLFRAHYLINKNLNLDGFDNVINVTNHSQISDLYQVADILITDYSSILFEFARTGKPIISYQEDKAEYEEKRGLYNISLEDLGIDIFNKWNDIEFDFTRKSHLINDLALVNSDLVDNIVQISTETVKKRGI